MFAMEGACMPETQISRGMKQVMCIVFMTITNSCYNNMEKAQCPKGNEEVLMVANRNYCYNKVIVTIISVIIM
jgi:hypothetical protein